MPGQASLGTCNMPARRNVAAIESVTSVGDSDRIVQCQCYDGGGEVGNR